ncbi:FAD-binding oxidoreductase [Rhodoplanes sp. TEM]|uniref:FAD-binding oxidoreductase n=1 Tax=Rhodoplanes tepidamans TaxID=200616 RepID=A0ABT5J3Z7_RHOTP|nr:MULTISPECIES: FAD-binding oxidoreductase [Rhodoplanes]MDC7784360.1 FAD-binding oxidoreductase [Rhodoplanes tepidamans]MDC7983376.1 FAD-binding oxidoreductase [Rhodoplanes sp. TEM]MDQ0354512.1 FAD/FMN-containing dehydrogenase [Rhodoplanes tepidamans]
MIADRLGSIVGPGGVLVAPSDLAGYRADSTHHAPDGILCVVRPSDTAQVAAVVLACRAAGVPIVPRGGGTGFGGGALPVPGQAVVVLSTERLRRIRLVDPVGDVLVAEAGVTLHEVQAAAAAVGRTVGLDHGGAGSSAIGGNIATNAGGNNVLRYGMARDQVLGVEAVLADGRVLAPPRLLRKCNAGYDLRHLLVGSEGTLAIVTAVALALRPAPVARATAMLGVATPRDALALLGLVRRELGEAVSAFELISRPSLLFHLAHAGQGREPLDTPTPWLVLVETEATSRHLALSDAFEAVLERALGDGLAVTGVVAASEAQRRALWTVREGIAVAMGEAKFYMVKTDTAVPIGRVPDFVDRVEAAMAAAAPAGSRTMAFGHVGDGNIHVNVLPPEGGGDSALREKAPDIARCIEDIALDLGGTVSAEHGIGQGKRAALARMLSVPERDLMRAVKTAFDPDGLFNPGKLFE